MATIQPCDFCEYGECTKLAMEEVCLPLLRDLSLSLYPLNPNAMQVVESGGRNIEVATMRQGEPLKIWSDEDVSAPWHLSSFTSKLGDI